jgi:hypothetical protein
VVDLSGVVNGDSGLKLRYDAKKQTITLSGVAVGRESRIPGDTRSTREERARQPDFAKMEDFGGGLGFTFDRARMPRFDESRGFTEKNRWLFARQVSIGTKAGESASQVVARMAEKINSTPGYRAEVTTKGATVTLRIVTS